MRTLPIVASATVISFAWLARAQDAPVATTLPARAEPVDDALCAGCHPAIVESYARTGMARAVEPIEAGELEGLAPVADEDGGFGYRFRQRGDDAWVVESWAAGAEGRPRERMVRLAFAIGAGLLDRSYAARLAGRAWFAPLEVVSARGDAPRHAALAPGHMMSAGLRFETALSEECLACHTDSLPPRDYPLNLLPRDFEPRGASCGVCHAGAAAHATWRELVLEGEAAVGKDPICSISGMDLPARLSVCARCHLQGDARIALKPGERGIPPAGEDFLERWAVYVPKSVDSDVAFVGHVERMLLSPCFEGSLGADVELSCELCHDPHTSVFEPAERERVRGACAECHPRGDGAGGEARAGACSLAIPEREGKDCVACHMRRTAVFDVAGVEIHDHYVRRQPGGSSHFEEIREKHSRDGRLRPFAWPGRPQTSVDEDRGLALMAALIAKAPVVAAGLVDAEPGAIAAALPTYHHLRGTLLEQMERFDEAAAAYERAIQLAPESATAAESEVNLALVWMRLNRGPEAIALCSDVLARHPKADGALRNRALIKLSLGDPAGFAADLEAAQRLYPRALNAKALAEHYRRLGDATQAGYWDAEAARLGP